MVDATDDIIIGDPPLIGEYVIIKNTNTGKFQKLRVAIHMKDRVIVDMKHVGFASLIPKDNVIRIVGDVDICFIRTYAKGKPHKMKEEYLFKDVLYSAGKKRYCDNLILGGKV